MRISWHPAPASLRYARQFAARRRVRRQPDGTMNRLYVVEPMPTPTGAKADHRLPLRAGDIEEFAWALATALGVGAAARRPARTTTSINGSAPIARDLQRNKGASLVIAGEQQPPIVHALAHAMNEKLGNVGKTVFYTDPVEANPVDQLASLQDLVKDLDAGAVDLLLILGGNPAFNAPVELGMRDRLQEGQAARPPRPVRRRDLGGVPVAPAGSALPGNLGRCARLRRHRHHPAAADRSRSTAAARRMQLLQMFTDQPETSRLRDRQGLLERRSTRAPISKPGGGAPCTMAWWPARRCPRRRPPSAARRLSCARRAASSLGGKLEVIFRPDPTIYDGRFANNGWLQELPKPITKLTWDNAALLSPATAHRLRRRRPATW